MLMLVAGTYQNGAGRLERDDSNYGREIEYGHMAGHMVSGVQDQQAFAQTGCNYTRRESITG